MSRESGKFKSPEEMGRFYDKDGNTVERRPPGQESSRTEPESDDARLRSIENAAAGFRERSVDALEAFRDHLTIKELDEVQRIQEALKELQLQKADSSVNALDYARAMRDAYADLEEVVEEVRERVGGDVTEETTQFINIQPRVEEDRRKREEKETFDREQNEIAELWDAQAEEWINWADKIGLYDRNTGLWQEDKMGEALKLSKLSEGQFRGLTQAMQRRAKRMGVVRVSKAS